MSYGHECRYCNQVGVTGYGCPGSPDNIHEDIHDFLFELTKRKSVRLRALPFPRLLLGEKLRRRR